ncbi:MAG: hypothetical protein U0M42_08925 [Acutalibacteraceae bacterium]|nr:hypothetical protein [Acutalibacteraceae bacterium]
MDIRLSMVHNNPGEKPFDTKFHNPEILKEYGYNGQVFKHINTVISFDSLGLNLFPDGSEEKRWLSNFSSDIKNEITLAKNTGLSVFYHVDLFVLPKKIVEHYKDDICDENGKISIDKEMTLQLHRVLLNELFSVYPQVDGLIIRVGETYLHDTPYHTGNGAVKYGDKDTEKKQFVKLLNFLREEVCVKHNKKLIFRTWDCFNDRFHTNLQYYLDVTDKIETHENLYFSIKHTALDFWRNVKWNDCLTQGKHQQIVEVQCQREYEGKGAYPSYVMDCVINGDTCNKTVIGLKDIVNHPLIKGVYTWPRGGGWYGPYSPNEFWSDINTYVIANYSADTTLCESDIFNRFAEEKMNLSKTDADKFRKLCLTANKAILKSRYISCYDKDLLNESSMPCCNWMRDDMLGGLFHLKKAFEVLFKENKLYEALKEKEEGLRLWEEAFAICKSIDWNLCSDRDFIITSCDYAVRLFDVVYQGFKVMVYGYMTDKGIEKIGELKKSINLFDNAWAKYKTLENNINAATLYKIDYYLYNQPGLRESVDNYRKYL